MYEKVYESLKDYKVARRWFLREVKDLVIYDNSYKLIDFFKENSVYIDYSKLPKYEYKTLTKEEIEEQKKRGLEKRKERKEIEKFYKDLINMKKLDFLPKNYEECYKILDLDEDEIEIGLMGVADDEGDYESLIKLVRCRNAYWKLLKNWNPEEYKEVRYSIRNSKSNSLTIIEELDFTSLLTFPQESVCNHFLTNFKELIKKCKKLI